MSTAKSVFEKQNEMAEDIISNYRGRIVTVRKATRAGATFSLLKRAFEFGQMWNTYHEMEEEFINYLEFVPLTADNRKVYSGKLLRLMLQLGGYLDTAFKEISLYKAFDHNQSCLEIREKVEKNKIIPFDFYLKTFEPIYKLSKRPVVVKRLDGFINKPVLIDRFPPFYVKEGRSTPEWWQAYNAVKHNMIKNMKEANVENTLTALSGAFLLNAIYEPSLISLIIEEIGKMYEVTSTSWKPLRKECAKEIILENKFPKKDITVSVDSMLFKCMVPRNWVEVQK